MVHNHNVPRENIRLEEGQIIYLMTDLTQFFNFNRPNGGYNQQSLGPHSGQQQASFDINEFPSLSKMSLLSQMQASSRANYVNIAKDNAALGQSSAVDSAQSEFTISSEDFPALPGSNNPNVSIIGTKSSGASAGSNKSSSSTSNNLNFTQTNIGGSGAGNSSNGAGNGSNNTASLGTHDIGATAAIDQCAKEKPYFSPLGSTPQRSMWINGPVDRSNLLGSPIAASTLEQRKLEEQARFRSDGINDHTSSGHASDFYKSPGDPIGATTISQAKDGLTTTISAPSSSSSSNPASFGKSPAGSSSIGSNNSNNKNQNSNSSGGKISIGVQISNDGRVTNIPSSMVTDQFGMIGLLAFLRAAETDPNLASVTFGTDLTALGLNLTASEKLYPSFAGPWADQPLKVYEIDYPVPSEYLVNSSIRDKLTQITLKRYHEDTIFFLFYMFPNDMLQIAAAIELYSREWRYHKEEKVWITRAPGIAPSEKTNSYERGTYYIFDALLWRRIPREFVLEYDRLESKPSIN